MVNGVKYTMQPFVSSTGEIYRGVFPEFPVKCEIRLPEYCMSDLLYPDRDGGGIDHRDVFCYHEDGKERRVLHN